MKELTKEEVLHVAKLARIGMNEEEMKDYQIKLKKLMDEVEKINDVEVKTKEILITPTDNETKPRKDVEEEMLNVKEVMKNVPSSSGNYIEVPVVINE